MNTINDLGRLEILPDSEELAAAAASFFIDLAAAAIAERGQFSVALSGGSSPRTLFSLLASSPLTEKVNWPRVHLFWGDERCVPPDHPDSNYRMAREMLLDHVALNPDHIHRVCGELDPETAAQDYADELHSFSESRWPRLDLILLGLGVDGHTASLFPNSPALLERESPTATATVLYQDRPAHRVTLTLPAINRARNILFLVVGPDKAEIVQAVLQGPKGVYPAQLIQPHPGQLVWMIDASAARLLVKEP